jgi:hypothetical protein
MSRKTIIVSDLSGREIDDGKGATSQSGSPMPVGERSPRIAGGLVAAPSSGERSERAQRLTPVAPERGQAHAPAPAPSASGRPVRRGRRSSSPGAGACRTGGTQTPSPFGTGNRPRFKRFNPIRVNDELHLIEAHLARSSPNDVSRSAIPRSSCRASPTAGAEAITPPGEALEAGSWTIAVLRQVILDGRCRD